MTVLNAACDAGFYYAETLATLRADVLRRLGYAAQVANPPPGMASLIDSFLNTAQRTLYRKLQGTGGELSRWYEWTMVEGERFYGILSNSDSCGKKLRRDQIEEVWIEDLNASWLPMRQGFDPSNFTMAAQLGLPCRYDVRQNIEVFPAPDAAYTLHVKGRFGLMRFTEDDDICSVDPDVLFLFALSRAKNHYGQPDAGDVAEEGNALLRSVISASHGTTRYVPRSPPARVATKPRMDW